MELGLGRAVGAEAARGAIQPAKARSQLRCAAVIEL
jgi:hypothetical protein